MAGTSARPGHREGEGEGLRKRGVRGGEREQVGEARHFEDALHALGPGLDEQAEPALAADPLGEGDRPQAGGVDEREPERSIRIGRSQSINWVIASSNGPRAEESNSPIGEMTPPCSSAAVSTQKARSDGAVPEHRQRVARARRRFGFFAPRTGRCRRRGGVTLARENAAQRPRVPSNCSNVQGLNSRAGRPACPIQVHVFV